MLLEVGVRDDVDLVALTIRPLDERQLPVRPARRAAVGRQVVHAEIPDVTRRLRVGRVQRRDALARAGRLVQVAGGHRSLHRDRGRAGVEVAAAEVVVGVPRVRRQREEHPCGGGREVRSYDEEGVGTAGLAVDVDRQDDLVVARRPVRLDGDVGRGRPPAPSFGGVERRRVIVGRDARLAVHDGAGGPDVRDLDVDGASAGRRHVQRDPFPSGDRLRPAVPRHRLVCHPLTLRGRVRSGDSHDRRTSRHGTPGTTGDGSRASCGPGRCGSATSTLGADCDSTRLPGTSRTSPPTMSTTPGSRTRSAGSCAAR